MLVVESYSKAIEKYTTEAVQYPVKFLKKWYLIISFKFIY